MLLRRRGFEVVPQLDGRFKVERQVLSAAEMVAKAHRMQARETSLRAGQGGVTHRSAPPKTTVNGHGGRLDDPAAAALLDRACRSLAEMVTMVTALEARGIDPVRLKAAIGTALPASRNIVHVLGTLADVRRRPGEEHRQATLPAPGAGSASGDLPSTASFAGPARGKAPK